MPYQNPPCLTDIFCKEDSTELNEIKSSGYFDVQEFGNVIKQFKTEHHLSVCNTNSRSLVKNKSQYDMLIQLLKDEFNFQFDVMSLMKHG